LLARPPVRRGLGSCPPDSMRGSSCALSLARGSLAARAVRTFILQSASRAVDDPAYQVSLPPLVPRHNPPPGAGRPAAAPGNPARVARTWLTGGRPGGPGNG